MKKNSMRSKKPVANTNYSEKSDTMTSLSTHPNLDPQK